MANTNAPFGFSQYQGTGATPSYEQTVSSIAAANSTAIYFGDPVVQATGTTGLGTGYIAQASAPQTLAISGIVVTAGVAVATFTATTAPAVGSTLVLTGTSFATGGGFNGTFQITASTTTTATFNVTGAYSSTLTGPGSATVFTPVAGVFVGCKYLSVSQKRTNWSNYWPGSDANGDVTAYIISDPNAQFVVQTGASTGTAAAVGLSSIGQNIGFAIGTGTASNGLSGAYADQATLIASVGGGASSNSLLPFRILSLANYTPGAVSPLATINGNDNTTAYNRIVVGFNNSMPRAFAGI
jgi:hypothetical protein